MEQLLSETSGAAAQGSQGDWNRIWPMLAQHHQVLTLDMLGFRFSDKPTLYDYSIEDQADLFEGWSAGEVYRAWREFWKQHH